MSINLLRVTITDDTGTRYTDLFSDIPVDDYEINQGPAGVRVDAIIPAHPYAPRASVDGPLGALLLRWAQAHVDARYFVDWEYIDGPDIHTIAIADTTTRELHFINIFGRVIAGRRAYRLRDLADALDLLIEPDFT